MPTQAGYTYDQVKQFCEILANLVHERLPDITSLERSPAKRQKKVYLDYLQNREEPDTGGPVLVRPTKAPGQPLHWDEANEQARPGGFHY